LKVQPEFELGKRQREQPKPKLRAQQNWLPEYDWPVLRRWPLNRQQ
jgi:hypothetical protein